MQTCSSTGSGQGNYLTLLHILWKWQKLWVGGANIALMNQIWANPSSSESVRISHYHPIPSSESLQPDLDNQGFEGEFAVWFSFFASVCFSRGWGMEYWFLWCDYTSTKPALDNEVWGLGVCAWKFCLLDLKGCRGRNTVLRSAARLSHCQACFGQRGLGSGAGVGW